jgi:hypothetical protein
VVVAIVYAALAARYWFYVPAIGAGLGFLCLASAWVMGRS